MGSFIYLSYFHESLIVKTVVSSNGDILYNIKLTKEKSRKGILNLTTSIFGVILTGAFALYLYKKYLHINDH